MDKELASGEYFMKEKQKIAQRNAEKKVRIEALKYFWNGFAFNLVHNMFS